MALLATGRVRAIGLVWSGSWPTLVIALPDGPKVKRTEPNPGGKPIGFDPVETGLASTHDHTGEAEPA
ncbi:hypothetical protein ACH40E_02345 [Streptomyces acidicola]|uniref:hypothetical protein n=1 Tax=Streptomyces acidicola TaxID=2596892 RepID=UPI0037931545